MERRTREEEGRVQTGWNDGNRIDSLNVSRISTHTTGTIPPSMIFLLPHPPSGCCILDERSSLVAQAGPTRRAIRIGWVPACGHVACRVHSRRTPEGGGWLVV